MDKNINLCGELSRNNQKVNLTPLQNKRSVVEVKAEDWYCIFHRHRMRVGVSGFMFLSESSGSFKPTLLVFFFNDTLETPVPCCLSLSSLISFKSLLSPSVFKILVKN